MAQQQATQEELFKQLRETGFFSPQQIETLAEHVRLHGCDEAFKKFIEDEFKSELDRRKDLLEGSVQTYSSKSDRIWDSYEYKNQELWKELNEAIQNSSDEHTLKEAWSKYRKRRQELQANALAGEKKLADQSADLFQRSVRHSS